MLSQPERGRGRGRGRDQDRGRVRSRGSHNDMEDDEEDYGDGQGMQNYDEEDYYEGYEEDDSDAIHQRFMSEEEEIYQTLGDQDSNHAFGDQDLREQRMPGR